MAARVESTGGVDRPRLTVAVAAPPGADTATSDAAVRRVGDYLSVDDDLGPFLAIVADDPPMTERARDLRGLLRAPI